MRKVILDRSSPTRRAYKMIAPYLQKHRRRIVVGAVCLFLAVGMRIVEPWPLQYVLDHVLIDHALIGRQDVVQGVGNPIHALAICGLVIIIIAAMRALFEYTRAVSFAWIGNRVVAEIRHDVFRHLQTLSLRFHNQSRRGDLTVRLVGDLNMIRDVAVTALLPMIASIVILIGMSAIMVWMHWRLGLMAIAVFPVFWFSATRSGRKIHDAARQQRSCEGALAATANESLASVKVVQALALEDHFAKTFSAQSKMSMKDGVKTSRLSAALERKVDVLIAIATALVLFQGSRYVLAGELTIGGLVVYLAYLKRGFKPLQNFAKYTGRISKALAAVDRIADILDESPDVQQRKDAQDAPALRGDIEFRGVSFGYVNDQWVLKDLSLTINAGQRVALVGPSGVGKSTLLSLICRLHDPAEGQVLIDGCDLREWTLASLRAQQSMVMQDNAIFADTVRGNIGLSNLNLSDAEIETAARIAGAHDFICSLPDGYDTALGERGTNLSRGQIQRIAVARATAQQSPVFLVDEPTTGLDENNQQLVIEGILQASQGRTTIMITHDLALASKADLIVVLEDGRCSEIGTHADLLREPGFYAEMFQNFRVRVGAQGESHAAVL